MATSAINSVLRKTLAVDPSKRPANCSELRQQLHNAEVFSASTSEIANTYTPPRSKQGRGKMLMIAGIVGIFFAPYIVGPIVWVIAHNDLKAMREGKLDDDDESNTNIARLIGMAASVLGVGMIVFSCLFMCAFSFLGLLAGN